MTTLTPPRERLDRGEGTGLGRPWNVIVLNDDHNTFQGVAFALSTVLPGVDYERGMTMANKIHHTGLAVVWSGQKEQAELYWEQLRGYGLTLAPLEAAWNSSHNDALSRLAAAAGTSGCPRSRP